MLAIGQSASPLHDLEAMLWLGTVGIPPIVQVEIFRGANMCIEEA